MINSIARTLQHILPMENTVQSFGFLYTADYLTSHGATVAVHNGDIGYGEQRTR